MDSIARLFPILAAETGSSSAAPLAVGIIMLAFGLACLLAGYRIFLVVFAIFASILGMSIGAALGGDVAGNIGAVVGAVLVGFLFLAGSRLLYLFNVFFVGSIIGASVMLAVMGDSVDSGGAVGLVLLGWVIGGLLALLVQRPFIILGTANLGAVNILFGAVLLMRHFAVNAGDWMNSIEGGESGNPFLMFHGHVVPIAAWLVLMAVGAFVQFKFTGTKMQGRDLEEQKEPKKEL